MAPVGKRILVVDDNAQSSKFARVLLEADGFEVATALDAEEALEALDAFLPSLILMDVQLPGMDGLELARRIKDDPRRHGIRILALTALAMKGDGEKALAAGCDDYIAKPADSDRLRKAVGDALADAREPRRARGR